MGVGVTVGVAEGVSVGAGTEVAVRIAIVGTGEGVNDPDCGGPSLYNVIMTAMRPTTTPTVGTKMFLSVRSLVGFPLFAPCAVFGRRFAIFSRAVRLRLLNIGFLRIVEFSLLWIRNQYGIVEEGSVVVGRVDAFGMETDGHTPGLTRCDSRRNQSDGTM